MQKLMIFSLFFFPISQISAMMKPSLFKYRAAASSRSICNSKNLIDLKPFLAGASKDEFIKIRNEMSRRYQYIYSDKTIDSSTKTQFRDNAVGILRSTCEVYSNEAKVVALIMLVNEAKTRREAIQQKKEEAFLLEQEVEVINQGVKSLRIELLNYDSKGKDLINFVN